MNDTFICKECFGEFDKNTLNKKGWLKCSQCLKKYQKAWREANKDKMKIDNAEYRKNKKAEISLQRKQYREANKEVVNKRNRDNWSVNGRKYSAQHYKWKVEKLKTDVGFRLQETIRSRFAMAIKGKGKYGSAIKTLGCSLEQLKSHLESLFKPGMTWDNYGLKGWHIDHIKPLSSFDLTDQKQIFIACHYTNLQPLWAVDNIRKSNKY